MTRHAWTDAETNVARDAAQRSESPAAAVAEATRLFGRAVTRDALDKALARRGMPSLAELVAPGGRRGAATVGGAVEPPTALVERPAPPPSELTADDHSDLDRVVRAVRGRPLDLLALCDKMNAAPQRVRELVALASKHGYRVRLADGHVALGATSHDDPTGLQDFGGHEPGRKRVGVVSDLHFGSRACAEAEIASFVRYCHAKGARTILVPGDVLDGSKKECVAEQDYVGFERQAARCIATMPRLDGLEYIAICGNHDAHFSSDFGCDAGKMLENAFRAAGRSDWHYLGAGTGFCRVDGAIFNLHHPHGSGDRPSSAVNLLSSRIDGYERGEIPDVLLQGHVHRFAITQHRGVWGVSCPSFQKNGHSVFGRRMKSASSVGGILISFDVDEHGRADAFSFSYKAISEIEHRCSLLTHVPVINDMRLRKSVKNRSKKYKLDAAFVCNKCGETKPPAERYPYRGRGVICTPCRVAWSAKYRADNLYDVKANQALYRAANKDKRKSAQMRYYERNRDRLLEDGDERSRRRREADPRVFMLRAARNRADRDCLPFDISINDLTIPEHCPVLGLLLVVATGAAKDNSPSLDKIVPKLGYVRGNVVVVSYRANRINGDASLEELKALVSYYGRHATE